MMLATLKTGDKVLSHYSLYGGTQELLNRILPPLGMEGIIADLRDLNKAEEALKTATLDDATKAKVTELIATGKAEHEAGKHPESEAALNEALKLLGV